MDISFIFDPIVSSPHPKHTRCSNNPCYIERLKTCKCGGIKCVRVNIIPSTGITLRKELITLRKIHHWAI